MPRPRPTLLVILDGWGCNPKSEANAIALANPPFYHHLLQTYPHTTLSASGEDVGLPAGQMGNSEVGHMNIGAGRIVYQEFTRINKAIADRSFHANKTLQAAIGTRESTGSLHLMGLLSDGGIHSHINHLIAILEIAKTEGVGSLIVHPFLDGRDTPPKSAPQYIKILEDHLKNAPSDAHWRIGTVMGRYYAMDRDQRWDRTKKAYDAIVLGNGEKASSALNAIEESFKKAVTDEFVLPIVICDGKGPVGLLQNNDRVIFYNFRSDRARQLTRAITDPDFILFERSKPPQLSSYVTLTQFDELFPFPVVFPPNNLDAMLGEVISRNGLRQFRLAETEKYPHVTYFFNGGREIPFELEERKLIPSPRHVATYDQSPKMSAEAVTDEAIRQIESGRFDFMVINFANPDMVGHSGNLKAAMEAVMVIDDCLEKIVTKTLQTGGAVLITADHGNLEQMIDYETGEPHTAHTTLPVPLILASSDENLKRARLKTGIHANIAPTLLDLMDIPKPQQMDQDSLICRDDS